MLLETAYARAHLQQEHTSGHTDRRDLDPKADQRIPHEVIAAWEKQGLVHTYNDFWENEYGDRRESEMTEKGSSYAPFMQAVKVFLVQIQLKRNAAIKEARRASIKAQLQALDEPEKAL